MTAVKEKAYAKINLFLDVLGKRADGFHDIRTVMHSISLSDEISVSVSPSNNLNIQLEIDGNDFLPTDEKNLAVRAAKLFFDKIGRAADVKIRLKKNIPIAAGLAGGSSDAAAVLRALNKIYRRPFTLKALLNIAAELGSDVPYCLVGKTALCEGRGEKITKIASKAYFDVVIASSGEHVSTPEAYLELDRKYSDFNKKVDLINEKMLKSLINGLKADDVNVETFYNIFETSVFEKCPRSKKLKEDILSLGAKFAMMSGSGPSVFGIFDSETEAKCVKQALISLGYNAWYSRSI